MSQNEEINFFNEMLKHPAVSTAGLISIILGFLLSMIVGVTGVFVPPLLFLTAMVVLSLFVPSSPVFQESAKRRIRREKRERSRDFLIDKLKTPRWQARSGRVIEWRDKDVGKKYGELVRELAALREIAENNQSSITVYDLENLEDATVDYLRLAYALQHMQSRSTDTAEIQKKLTKLEKQIDKATGSDRKKLEILKVELEASVARRDNIPFKMAAVEAQMESMYHTFTDIHHQVVANPGSLDAGTYLREAAGKLRVEEELALDTELELSSGSNESEELRKARARVAAKAKELQHG